MPLVHAGFDKEDLASGAGPRQPGHHASVFVSLVGVAVEGRFAEQALHLRWLHLFERQLSVAGIHERHFAQGLVDLLLQLSDAALAGVLFDDFLQCGLGERRFCFEFSEARVLQFARHEVSLANFHFLLGDISGHLYDLHAVEQGCWQGAEVVGGGYEEHLRQVVVHIEEIVVEGVVLLRVEHLEQGRRGVSVDGVLRHLVDLVEDKHGVRRSRLLYALDDASGHGSHVGASVSANLALVVQASERHAHILALHGRGDALAQRCLTHSRRTVEAEDGRLEVASELQHGQILQYALLHLLHAIVVVVEHALGALDVEVVLGIFVPGQGHHLLQVVDLHAVFGALRVEHVELVELLGEGLGNLLGPFLVFRLFEQFFLLGRFLVASQFLLDVLHLLMQEVLALLLVEVLVGLLANLVFQFLQLYVAVFELQQPDGAFLHVVGHEQLHLFLRVEGQAGAEEVDEHHLVGDVLQRHQRLVGYVVVALDEVCGGGSHVLHDGPQLLAEHVGHDVGNGCGRAL